LSLLFRDGFVTLWHGPEANVMSGESVCEVIASDRPGYAARDIVLAPTGWRTHAASDTISTSE
jgi:NADPH-dependent curcumin reductase CurA